MKFECRIKWDIFAEINKVLLGKTQTGGIKTNKSKTIGFKENLFKNHEFIGSSLEIN